MQQDFIVWVLVIIGGGLWMIGSGVAGFFGRRSKRARLASLYGDAAVVEAIMAARIWQGMTAEQLQESWGHPDDVDERVLKSGVRLTCKYGQTGKNRFARRAYLEDGIVIGWEQK